MVNEPEKAARVVVPVGQAMAVVPVARPLGVGAVAAPEHTTAWAAFNEMLVESVRVAMYASMAQILELV